MGILIGNTLISAATLKALARGCIDGSALVDKLVARCPEMTHDDHMAVLRWWYRVMVQLA